MKYFCEFEFKSSTSTYWFPIIINAASLSEAQKIKQSIETAIEDNFSLKRSNIVIFSPGVNSQYLEEYVQHQLKGVLQFLTMNMVRFNCIPNMPNLNFNEHLELYEVNGDYDGTVLETIRQYRFPVRKISLYQHNTDFLVLNVIQPD